MSTGTSLKRRTHEPVLLFTWHGEALQRKENGDRTAVVPELKPSSDRVAQFWHTYLSRDYREVEARVWLGLDTSDTGT